MHACVCDIRALHTCTHKYIYIHTHTLSRRWGTHVHDSEGRISLIHLAFLASPIIPISQSGSVRAQSGQPETTKGDTSRQTLLGNAFSPQNGQHQGFGNALSDCMLVVKAARNLPHAPNAQVSKIVHVCVCSCVCNRLHVGYPTAAKCAGIQHVCIRCVCILHIHTHMHTYRYTTHLRVSYTHTYTHMNHIHIHTHMHTYRYTTHLRVSHVAERARSARLPSLSRCSPSTRNPSPFHCHSWESIPVSRSQYTERTRTARLS